MTDVYVDTSAFYPLLVGNDRNAGAAAASFEKLLDERCRLHTTSYVVCELVALLQNRVGLEAVRAFQEGIQPLLEITWIDARLHEETMERTLGGGRRISLVDASGFVLMDRLGIHRAFAFDPDFERAGFELVRG